MNSLLKFVLRPALAAGVALAFTSCETYSEGYGDPGGYSGGYYSGGGGYVSRPYYGSGYGGGYYSSDYYRRNGGRYDRNDHRNDHNDHRNDNHRGNDNRKSGGGSDNDLRLTKYREGAKPGDLPSGYHSKEWYKDRGYSLNKNNYVTRDGDPRGNANNAERKGGSNNKSDKGDRSGGRSDKKR